jgi:hypothetical protein
VADRARARRRFGHPNCFVSNRSSAHAEGSTALAWPPARASCSCLAESCGSVAAPVGYLAHYGTTLLPVPARKQSSSPRLLARCLLVVALYKQSRARQPAGQSAEFRQQAEERNSRPFPSTRRGGLWAFWSLFWGTTAWGGGARMTPAAAAATMRMAAPWVLACSLLLCLATFQGECCSPTVQFTCTFFSSFFFPSSSCDYVSSSPITYAFFFPPMAFLFPVRHCALVRPINTWTAVSFSFRFVWLISPVYMMHVCKWYMLPRPRSSFCFLQFMSSSFSNLLPS